MNTTADSLSSSERPSKKCSLCKKGSDRPLLKMTGSVLALFQERNPDEPRLVIIFFFLLFLNIKQFF